MVDAPKKLLIAASGTGGHLFPAIATAEQLADYSIEWLGVPDRLETQLVPKSYPLHTVNIQGFQQSRIGLSMVLTFGRMIGATFQVRRWLKQGRFAGVLTTGGYIAAPAILAARSLGLPTILHESNALPGKVTRWLSPWCTRVALGFDAAAAYLPRARCITVGTPVRSQFRTASAESALADLAIPPEVPLVVVVGGSQGAVAVNQRVRKAAPAWLEAGIWIVHLTGSQDPDAETLSHPHYRVRPFYDHMAALLQRADLAVSRAGAGTLTELAITGTPSILIPYPYAAEDHQTYNASIFAAAGAATVYQQSELTAEQLQMLVLDVLKPDGVSSHLKDMAIATKNLAIADSAERLADLIRETI